MFKEILVSVNIQGKYFVHVDRLSYRVALQQKFRKIWLPNFPAKASSTKPVYFSLIILSVVLHEKKRFINLDG